MLSIEAKKRSELGKDSQLVREKGLIPAVLYGPRTDNTALSVDRKSFQKVYEEAGESTLVTLEVEKEKTPVLIYDIQFEPISGDVRHIDFYQPPLDKKIEVAIPVVFVGEAPAVKEMRGTLLKNIQEVDVRAFPQDLPHQIDVDITSLKEIDQRILVKDVIHSDKVEILRAADEIVVQIIEMQNVEEELEKPVEENVEAVAQIKEEKKEEEEEKGAEEAK